MNTKPITEQQYDEACRIKEEYEAQPQHDFIPGEFVQGRDSVNNRWSVVFVYKGIDSDGMHRCSHIESTWEISWKYIRRPVDVPGILIRWTGGECPVSDKDAKVMTIRGNMQVEIGRAKHMRWNRIIYSDDIIAYMILPEHMK